MKADKKAVPTIDDTEQGTRPVTVRYKGGEYPGVAKGNTFLGLYCAKPRCRPEEWAAAVKEAMER